MSTMSRDALRQEADRRWYKLGREHPELEEDNKLTFGRGLVERYIDELPAAADVKLDVAEARAKLGAGTPLLEDVDLRLDLRGARRFFRSLCGWAMEQPALRPDAQRLERAVLADEHFVDRLMTESLAGNEPAIQAEAEKLGADITVLKSLTGFTVSAALMETARSLEGVRNEAGVEWHEAYCPVCGGPPLLSELQGSEGLRHLRCASCGAGWPFSHTTCVHCGSVDDRAQHYLSAEGQAGKYRVDVCDHCHGYLKSVTNFAPTPSELLTIEDMALLHLDAVATARGYVATPFAAADTGAGDVEVASASR